MLPSENISRLIREISSAAQLRTEDIPDIELYMDQVTTFMDNKLSGYKRNEEDKVLTKAMINNYAKAGLLIPPRNKKYSRDNMILLLLIYHLKQMLSINDIGQLFSHLFLGLKDDGAYVQKMYETFLETEQDRYAKLEAAVFQELESIPEITGTEPEEVEQQQWFLLAMLLLSRAENEKRLAEKIIDKYF